MAAMADWSQLNEDMIQVIVEKLSTFTDYVRFRAVYHGWRFFIPDNPPKRLQQRRFPYLMLPPSNTSPKFSLLSSLDLNGDTVDQFQLPPRLGGRGDEFSFRGICKDWLIVIEKEGPSIYLINPFTKEQKLLPPIYTFPQFLRYYPGRAGKEVEICSRPKDAVNMFSYSYLYIVFFVKKIVLSSPPTGTNYIAMAIYGERFTDLVYCQCGDERWTGVGEETLSVRYEDIVFYKDKFYVVNYNGRVISFSFNYSDSSTKAVPVREQVVTAQSALLPPNTNWWKKLYLVVVETSYCDHHLLLVTRLIDLAFVDGYPTVDGCYSYTSNFIKFKLNLNLNNPTWERMWGSSDDDDRVLFLGWNESLSFPSECFHGCKGSLVYFTDDVYNKHIPLRGSDVGVFNFEKNWVERIPALQYPKSLWPPPMWIMHHVP